MTPRRKSAGPSAVELKLRTEIDRLRRELAKAAKDAASPPAVLSASTPSAGPLEARVGELERTRERLSRLYFAQVEENRRRSAKLHQMLRLVSRINADHDAESLLRQLAIGIQESLGFRIVFIRLREPGGTRFLPAAAAGLSQAALSALSAQEVRIEQVDSWMQDDVRIGRSYLIGHAHPRARSLPAGYVPDLGRREEWEWHAEDALLVPLLDAQGNRIGYLSVDDPADRLVPSKETIELLEMLAGHAGIAIENARLYRRLLTRAVDLERTNEGGREVDRLKRRFVSTVSHELRTPLTAIRAYVDTLLATGLETVSGERLEEFLRTVDEESRRLSRLIESVLDLGRFDAGNAQARRQPLDLAQLVEETAWLLGRMSETRQVEFKVARELDDTSLDADRDQLRQLVLHLGSNAIKFTPAGGTVLLKLSGDEQSVVLEVEDTGIGIPEEALEKIFDRFYQVDSSLARRYGGSGLGLAISKSIVEWHGGTIAARSRPGEGSSFTVTLPRRVGPRVTLRPDSSLPPAALDVLRLGVEMVSEIMDARVVSVMSADPDGGLLIEAALGLDMNVVRDTRNAVGLGVSGWVAEHRRPVCVARREDAILRGSGRERYRSGTFLCVPLESGDRLLGVLNVTDPSSDRPFQLAECHLLLELALAIGHAWRGAADAEARQTGVAEATQTLRRMLEHVRQARRRAPHRIRLAQALSRAIGLSEAESALIGFAATVHDVGMTAVDARALDSAGPLSPAQRAEMQRHVEIGAEMLESLETMGAEITQRLSTMGAVREIVLSHHEWWDGSGYPRGLAGEAIPVGARVLAVVDAFESLTAGRGYRPPQSRDETLQSLRALRGTQFDPAVVDAMERVVRDEGTSRSATEPAATGEGR